MTTFDKREEGFEKKFAHDEELRFKANARRNKLLGLWAAEKLGLTGAAAEAYAKEVVMADFEEAGDDDVFRKVRKDFDAKGVAQSDQDIRNHDRLDGEGHRADQDGQITSSAMRRWRGCRAVFLMDSSSWPTLLASPSPAVCRRRNRVQRLVRLPAPIVAETIAREGFVAVTLDQQHGLWDTAATAVAIACDPRRAARRRSCAFRSASSRRRAARSTSAPKASSRR